MRSPRQYDAAMAGAQDGVRERLRIIARRVMRERGFEPEFPRDALVQLQGIAAAPSEPGLSDLCALPWCSIDNDDSRDLDQLTVAVAVNHEHTRLLVAVADVDATVRRGSPIDAHAERNTTSVYTVPEVFAMLPPRLSTDLTSLNPGADRLAVVIELTVALDGSVVSEKIDRALVRNHAQLAYASVAAWLDGGAAAPAALAAVPGLDQNLRLQAGVAARMRARRHREGALTLVTSEPRAVFEGGRLADLKPETPNAAKELIEDLMIAANGAVARFLGARGVPVLRRILKIPERWARIVQIARTFGTQLPPLADARALNEFLLARRTADPAGFSDLSLAVVKLLGRGEYQLQRPGAGGAGHFGLAVTDYAHSTAPNRRYPDLLTQRLLKAALRGDGAAYTDAELAGLAAHCTEREDAASKVERAVRKSAAALLLAGRIGERFEAVVTGVTAQGTWVRIAGPAAEGRVVRAERGMRVGDRVRVELIGLDVERGFIDFAGVRA
jgi:VacB/RNase II family 3'-5' exoribonuclease